MLLFELTRDYDVILPLMASAGVGTVWSDILEDTFQKVKAQRQRRDEDTVSWGDLSVSETSLERESSSNDSEVSFDRQNRTLVEEEPAEGTEESSQIQIADAKRR